MTRAQYEHFCTGLYHLATDIGLHPAARALGISLQRARKISSRRKWNLRHLGRVVSANLSPDIDTSSPRVTSEEVKQRVFTVLSDRTKLGLATAATSASEHLATLDGKSLTAPTHGIAADTWSRTADRVHGWQAERQKPLVQIANVTLPTPEEEEERRKAHRALDEIARSLGLRE